MMMILIVNLDLRGPAATYDPLYDTLKNQGKWWHYMRWTWLLNTSKTPDELIDIIRPLVNPTDRILISVLGRPYQGLLLPEEWKWIKEQVGGVEAPSGPVKSP